MSSNIGYRILIIDPKSVEDLGEAIYQDVNARRCPGDTYIYSYSDAAAVISKWLGLQPEVPRRFMDDRRT